MNALTDITAAPATGFDRAAIMRAAAARVSNPRYYGGCQLWQRKKYALQDAWADARGDKMTALDIAIVSLECKNFLTPAQVAELSDLRRQRFASGNPGSTAKKAADAHFGGV